MRRPVISIIIPIYNVAKFLQQTLLSVQNQTWKDFEVICINDGSTDGSLEIIEQFVAEDKRFKLIDQPNMGASAARNIGLKKAWGEYIMFLDGDDYLHPQIMATALTAMAKSGADVCQFGYRKVSADEKVEFRPFLDKKITLIKNPFIEYIKETFKPSELINTKIYKAELAKNIAFQPYEQGEDSLYVFEVIKATSLFAVISVEGLYYVQHPAAITHRLSEEQLKINKNIIYNRKMQMMHEYAKQNNSPEIQAALVKCLKSYERYILKYLLVKPLRQGTDDDTLAENYQLYKQRIEKGDCYLSGLKIKHRILLKLLEKGYYKAARFLMWF